MNAQSAKDVLRHATGVSIGWAVLMIVLGFFAVALPLATGIGVAIFFGWIIVFSGFAHLAYAFSTKGAGAFLWQLLIGVVYVLGGFYIAFHPILGLESLTLLLASVLFAEGVLRVIAFFQFRSLPGSGWILFDGLATLLLAFLILYPWPSSSVWAIGTLVGINLIASGFSRLMYSMTAQRTLKAMAA